MTTDALTAQAPSDAKPEAIEAAYTAAEGDIDLAALALWYRKENELITAPAKWTANGDYSQDTSTNITAVGNKVRKLEAAVGLTPTQTGETDSTLGTFSTGHMVTRRRGRRGGQRHLTSIPKIPRRTESTSIIELRTKLAAITTAITQALTNITNDITFDNVTVTATEPTDLDVTGQLSTVTNVEVWDADDNQITSGISTPVDFPTVSIVSDIALTGLTVVVTGAPPE